MSRAICSAGLKPAADSGLLKSWNQDELTLGPKAKKLYWPRMNTDEHG